MEYGENEAVTEREAETLRRGVRRMPPQMRSKARIIEEEDRFEDAGPMKNGLVHRMNERNKPSTRRETPDSHRGMENNVTLTPCFIKSNHLFSTIMFCSYMILLTDYFI